MFPLIKNYQNELNEIKESLQNEVSFKTASFEDLIEINLDELDLNACSLIVLSVNAAYGGQPHTAVGLAKIIQYIYMADQVHRIVSDDPNLTEKNRQFPVLVGDFLFGRFFQQLCKQKLHHFLNPLAKVIGEMNEGTIRSWLLRNKEAKKEELIHILEMERASLTATAARLSANIAGCSEKVQAQCEDLGKQLGLAWAASQSHLEASIVHIYLGRAREIVESASATHKHKLKDLVDYMETNLKKAE